MKTCIKFIAPENSIEFSSPFNQKMLEIKNKCAGYEFSAVSFDFNLSLRKSLVFIGKPVKSVKITEIRLLKTNANFWSLVSEEIASHPELPIMLEELLEEAVILLDEILEDTKSYEKVILYLFENRRKEEV